MSMKAWVRERVRVRVRGYEREGQLECLRERECENLRLFLNDILCVCQRWRASAKESACVFMRE